jgi:hypothetical protein
LVFLLEMSAASQALAQPVFTQVPGYPPVSTTLFESPHLNIYDRIDFDGAGLGANLVVSRAQLQSLLNAAAPGRFTPVTNPSLGPDEAAVAFLITYERVNAAGQVYSEVIIVTAVTDSVPLPGSSQIRGLVLAVYFDNPAGSLSPAIQAGFDWTMKTTEGTRWYRVNVRAAGKFRLNVETTILNNTSGDLVRADPPGPPALPPNPFYALSDGSEFVVGSQFFAIRATDVNVNDELNLPYGTLRVLRVFNHPKGPLDAPGASPAAFPHFRRNGSYVATFLQ